MLVYLNVYAITRHYGGPEEGGWWYNSGVPVACVPMEVDAIDPRLRETDDGDDGPLMDELVPESYERVQAQIEKLRRMFIPEGDISSVLGGVDYSFVMEREFGKVWFGKVWPETRPHYE